MSKFRVGERVGWVVGSYHGVVVEVRDNLRQSRVKWDDAKAGEAMFHDDDCLRPLGPGDLVAPQWSIGDLVHPSGARVEAAPITFSLGTDAGRYFDASPLLRLLDEFATPNLDDMRREMAEMMTARADLLAARDEHQAMRAALDTVRKFLASHSLESTTRRCQQEAREVMAVVLRSLDSDKAGK